ncbi:OmpP1/FadL family transporter [Flavobacterium sp. AED]|uniref:OmpP1/FadL family transporter n=1 Tax=Flavobacterium sp. AED TaxID=1423323 RepID=UPI00057EA4A6|nr:outer membrane protein transport protein [Flavobacterium sp. AED]KIA85563.1 transporter [Flavobacterium sp. AED]MDI1306864.1 outer membrane protein transport protein [bacterium]
MKKYLFLLLTGFTFSAVQSQEITDAMRYAQDNLNGTARFRAMGGAFGALGGDLSSLNINPAGSAVFSNNQIGATLSSYNTKNNSNYFGSTTTDKNNSFDLNQAGGVFVFKNQNSNSNWKKFSLGVNYDNVNNYNNSIFSAGTNPTNSVDGYFLSYANGVPLSDLRDSSYGSLNHGAQQAFLGYQGYVINPESTNSNNTQYTSNVPAGGNYYQENTISTNGYNGKLSFNAATSYKDKLYIGLNLNSHFTDYRQSTSFYEDNSAPLTTDYTITRLRFDNELYTYGTGFSFQIGAIAKVTNEVRLGLAYESSTWYHLSDEFSQKLVAVSSAANLPDTNDVVDPQITNVYAPYKLQTPSKLTGSFAYVFGKSGLISIDYAMKDYSNTKFKPENDSYFRDVNSYMNSVLDKTNEVRVGAEYKIEQLSLRAGYRYEQSPYKNKTTVGDLTGYSGGLGYNFGSTKVDLSYSTAKRNSQQGFFSQGFTDGAKINTMNNNVSLTLLFEL